MNLLDYVQANPGKTTSEIVEAVTGSKRIELQSWQTIRRKLMELAAEQRIYGTPAPGGGHKWFPKTGGAA